MKKKFLAIITVICMCVLVGTLVACGGGGETEKPNDEKQSYNISVENGEGYTIEAPATAKKDDKVVVTIKLTNKDLIVNSVKANDTVLTSEGNNSYSFIMPGKAVKITAQTSVREEILQNGKLSLAIGEPTIIAQNAGHNIPITSDEKLWKIKLDFDSNDTTRLSSKSKITSSDESVIPNNAMEFEPITKEQGNRILGMFVKIDSSKINKGTTWLEIFVLSDNASVDYGTIMLKITVVEYGELQVETAKKTLELDLSELSDVQEGDDYTLRMFDQNFVDGSNTQEWNDYTVKVVDGKLTIEFDYALGHRYTMKLVKGTEFVFETNLTIENKIFGQGIWDPENFEGYTTNDGLMYQTLDKITLKVTTK